MNLKMQTSSRPDLDVANSGQLLEERPQASGEKCPKILIFGDELISDLDQVLTDEFKYAIEVHMLDGAQTKNIQKYISESIGTRKDAQVCIFHVGTNDISARRTERNSLLNQKKNHEFIHKNTKIISILIFDSFKIYFFSFFFLSFRTNIFHFSGFP